MNLKKILMLSAVSVAVLSGAGAYAGGPDMMAPPPCPAYLSSFVPFLYIGGSAGWAYSDWNSFIASGLPSDAGTNGFTYGGKVGYQFLDNFGIEGGGFVLPDSEQTLSLAQVDPVFSVSGTAKSWFAYGAATIRGAFPGNPFFHVIGKVGGAYREVNHSGALYTNVGSGSYATVIFGAGLEYDFAANNLPLAFGVDYLYVPASADSWFATNPTGINENAAPAAQVVVGTLSLHFAV